MKIKVLVTVAGVAGELVVLLGYTFGRNQHFVAKAVEV